MKTLQNDCMVWLIKASDYIQSRVLNIRFCTRLMGPPFFSWVIPTYVTEKAFHKNAKTCRAGFHKKPTKQDGTHMTIRSQITIPTSIFPTTHTIIPYSLFWNGCVYMCVVNSRIGLWGLWVGVCIEGSREYSVMGF